MKGGNSFVKMSFLKFRDEKRNSYIIYGRKQYFGQKTISPPFVYSFLSPLSLTSIKK
jgi:hypothetical protein